MHATEPRPGGRWTSACAGAFAGFSLLIAVDTVCVGLLNPDRHLPVFWVNLIVVFGGFLCWTAWVAYRLFMGSGTRQAVVLLSVLTGLIVVGALVQAASARSRPEVLQSSVLTWLRLVSAAYLGVLWVVVLLARKASTSA